MKLQAIALLLALAVPAADAFVAPQPLKAPVSFTTLEATRPNQQQQQHQRQTSTFQNSDTYGQMLENTNPRQSGMARSPNKPGAAALPVAVVQGGSLKTWSLQSTAIERVQITMSTEGRPLDADVDLWNGPDNTPQKMRVYVEDGDMRPFNAIVETPRGPNTVAIRNIGQMEFPLAAQVTPNPIIERGNSPYPEQYPRTVQGGAMKTYPYDSQVQAVAVMLRTDGRPLNARIELLQGPNNNKQVIEVYIEDGTERPFYAIIETPGSGNVVRVVNTSPIEFPLTCSVEPYRMGDPSQMQDIVVSGDEYGGRTGSSFGWDEAGMRRGNGVNSNKLGMW